MHKKTAASPTALHRWSKRCVPKNGENRLPPSKVTFVKQAARRQHHRPLQRHPAHHELCADWENTAQLCLKCSSSRLVLPSAVKMEFFDTFREYAGLSRGNRRPIYRCFLVTGNKCISFVAQEDCSVTNRLASVVEALRTKEWRKPTSAE